VRAISDAHVFVRPKEGPESGYNERQARPTHHACAAGDDDNDCLEGLFADSEAFNQVHIQPQKGG
jgi:hypothetical protein